MPIKGIDISEHQGVIDFKKVAKTDVKFVIPRVGYGRDELDKYFFTNVRGAKEAGLKIPAVYHFSYAINKQNSYWEAVTCWENVKAAGLPKDTIIFFDYEYDSCNYAKRHGVTVDKKLCSEITEAFCKEIEKQGYKAGIYTNVDYLNNMFDKSLLDKYIVWIADWTGKSYSNYMFHQYSAKGKIDGISGDVDCNYWYDSNVDKSKEIKITVDTKTTQSKTPEIQNGNSKVAYAKSQNYAYSGTYIVTASALNMRYSPGVMTEENVVEVIPKNAEVQNYGYYTPIDGKTWLLVQHGDKTGYVMKDYVKRK